MYINNYLEKMNIEPISEIGVRERCEFTNNIVATITENLVNYNLDYLKMLNILQNTEMYIAKIPKNLSPVNYLYLDGKMYISEDINLNPNNEFVLHEAIHRIQEYRNKKEKLIQLGLCDVMETKIKGLALNEAAIQYIVHRILNGESKIIDIYGMKVPTLSKDYYPILTNLIEQITFLIGEDKLIDSTINSNNEFKYEAIDMLGEDTYKAIENSFEQILEAKNVIIKNNEKSIIDENIELIKKIYVDIQNKIMVSYFNKEFKRIKSLEQLNSFSTKLVNHKDYIGSDEAQALYSDYFKTMQEQIKEKEQSFINKSLIVVKENRFVNIFNRIKKFIKNLVFQT